MKKPGALLRIIQALLKYGTVKDIIFCVDINESIFIVILHEGPMTKKARTEA